MYGDLRWFCERASVRRENRHVRTRGEVGGARMGRGTRAAHSALRARAALSSRREEPLTARFADMFAPHLLAGSLLIPRLAPVLVRGEVGVNVLQELVLLNAHHVENGSQAHGVLALELRVPGATARGDVRVSAAVNHALGSDHAAPALVPDDDAGDFSAFHDCREGGGLERAMQV